MLNRPPRLPASFDAAWYLVPALVLVAAVGASLLFGLLDELPKSSQAPASTVSVPSGG